MAVTIQDVLDRLEGVKSSGNGRWMAKCPCHEDDKASLQITAGDTKILLHCFAGCEFPVIAAWLNMGSLETSEPFAAYAPAKKSENGKHGGTIVATYDYTDEDGTMIYQSVRKDPKGFFQRHPDGKGGWIDSIKGVRRVPYRLHELLESESTVYIVEGEKDADRLRSLGLTATTNSGGAKNWNNDYCEFMAGRRVVILPDNDKPGWEHAKKVENSLDGIAESAVIVKLPGLKPKGDVSDWLDAGNTLDDLLTIAERVRSGETPLADGVDDGFQLPSMSSAELFDADFRLEFLIDRVLVKNQPMIVGGVQKTLKTSFLIDMAISIGTGLPFLGEFQVEQPQSVLLLSSESGNATIQETAKRIATAKVANLRDANVRWGFTLPQFSIKEQMDVLASEIDKWKIQVVMIDPTYLAMLEIGNDAASLFAVGKVLAGLTNVANQTGATTILAHHARAKQARDFPPMELNELAFAGFSEWTRQWLLLARREKYTTGSGSHAMWATTGGSAGHNGLWAIQIEEGNYQNEGGRIWDVAVERGTEAIAENRSNRKNRYEDPSLQDFADRYFDEDRTINSAKSEAVKDGMPHRTFDRLKNACLDEGILWPTDTKGKNCLTQNKDIRIPSEFEISDILIKRGGETPAIRKIRSEFGVGQTKAENILKMFEKNKGRK